MISGVSPVTVCAGIQWFTDWRWCAAPYCEPAAASLYAGQSGPRG
ncbi:hypothetical protein RS82_00696 [Microbacterium trichothecenolyticum]|uniref:Uncharacterized protein n=1 Tax=Microbacterium trichothecenolyticum TaxID=69370 RepID=A0A0M2HIW4_MICTR|nr:hypothetical protein RS82_00696 [Microbacterium trichothecenolyticum]